MAPAPQWVTNDFLNDIIKFAIDHEISISDDKIIVMGAGASARKYNILKQAGLHDISTIRAFFQLEGFDAGTLAYVLCQNRFLEWNIE